MNRFDYFTNVILFTRGTKGDLYPFLCMGKDLQKKGCKVTLLSNYCYERHAIQEGIGFAALDDEQLFNTLNNIPEFYSKLPALLKLYKEYIVLNLERELNIIESRIEKSNTVLVAHSNDYLSPMFAMEKFNVPLYLSVLAPSFIHSFVLFEAVLNSLSNELNQIRHRVGLEPVKNWGLWLRKFNGCFAFWPEWFSAEATEIVPNLEYVGFLSIESIEKELLQCEVTNFLQGNSKKILLTHGTSKPFNEKYFRLVIDVCQEFDCKLIVGTQFRALLPDVLPDKVVWVEYCPFHELLPDIDLIIHHGGIGTVRESVANEVPQLIIGQGFDRQHNGRIIKNLALGDWVAPKALCSDVLQEKIKELFGKKEQIRSMCKKYKPDLCSPEKVEYFYEKIIDKVNFSNPASESTNIPGCQQFVTAKEESLRRDVGNNLCSVNNIAVNEEIANKNKFMNKQELLLKMLKNRTKEIRSRSANELINND